MLDAAGQLNMAAMRTHKSISDARGKDIAFSLLVIVWAICETIFKGFGM